jgi:threonine dehydrogenase-like Zn-dependent dehydrogenase
MLAAKLQAGGPALDLVEVDDPSPGRGECLVAVAACGICASDLRFLAGKGDASAGRILGHEATGTVAGLGHGVDPRLAGRLVAIDPIVACGECDACLAGDRQRCRSQQIVGIHRDGSFAQRAVVPAANLVPLPANADPVATALTEPFSVGRHALGANGHRSVAVIGAGGIGLGAIAIARARGIERVIAVDVSEPALERARACGAEAFTPEAAVAEQPVELVVDCTGVTSALALAVELAAPGGELALAGITADSVLPYEAFVRKELRARGAFAYTHQEFEGVATAIGSGELDVAPVGAEAVPLTAINEAIETLRREPGAHSRLIVVPDPAWKAGP